MLEKIIFKKVHLWIVLLLFIFFLIGAVLFSSMVRHVATGGLLLGKWTPLIENVAKFPGKIIYLFRSNAMKVDPQIADTDADRSLKILNKKYFDANEDGYLLVSTYDYENGSFILLYSLKEDKEIYRWIPPIKEIHDQAPDFKDGINSFRYYRSQHPLLMNNGDVIFSSGEGPLVRLSKCNEIKWIIPEIFHHSNQKHNNEDLIYAVKRLKKNESNKLIYDDGYAVINANSGTQLEEYSVEKILLQNEKNLGIIYGIGDHERDRYHVNQVYPVTISDEYVQKDDVFISIRNLSMVVLYRPAENKIIWQSVGPWINQHDVRYLGNGKISVFGNNVVRGLDKNFEFLLGHSDIYIYDISNDTYSLPFTKVMKSSKQRSGGIFKLLSNGDGFSELSSDMIVKRFNKEEVIWEYVHYLGNSKKGNLNWTRYLDKSDVNLENLNNGCK